MFFRVASQCRDKVNLLCSEVTISLLQQEKNRKVHYQKQPDLPQQTVCQVGEHTACILCMHLYGRCQLSLVCLQCCWFGRGRHRCCGRFDGHDRAPVCSLTYSYDDQQHDAKKLSASTHLAELFLNTSSSGWWVCAAKEKSGCGCAPASCNKLV